MRSSYSRSLISQCTSPALIDSVHSPLGDRRQRSPANINGAVGKVDLSSEVQQNQSNAEASSNARTRSQRFLRVNPTSEIAPQRTLHVQPSVQDTFHDQAEHLPYGQSWGMQFVPGIKPISPPFLKTVRKPHSAQLERRYSTTEIE